MKFQDMPYKRVDFAEIQKRFQSLMEEFQNAKSGEEQFEIHKLNPFVCHRRKLTTFRWWEEPCESLAIHPDSQYTFV